MFESEGNACAPPPFGPDKYVGEWVGDEPAWMGELRQTLAALDDVAPPEDDELGEVEEWVDQNPPLSQQESDAFHAAGYTLPAVDGEWQRPEWRKPPANGRKRIDPELTRGVARIMRERGDDVGDERDERLFRRWTMPELLAEPDEFEWRAKGLIVAGTYGPLAGEQKSLKTHIAQFIDVALAAGVPVFGRFEVAEACPVSTYVGEGGRRPYRRRLERVAAAMGVNLADIPLFPSFDIAPIDSPAFRLTLERDLAEVQPGHVDIDPYYAFHGASDPKNLHDEGAALTALSATVVDAGASLKVVNHYNQTGTGRGLNRITMAGSAEWADSWWLVSHRAEPDVRNGRFRLLLDVGSRQWGGNTWDLDLDVGTFDIDTGEFDGDITWAIAPHIAAASEANAEEAVIDTLVHEPWQHTKTQLVKVVGGKAAEARAAINRLERQKRIDHALVAQPEGEGGNRRMVKRDRYAMTNEPLPEEPT